jgi:hypothetical protein
LVPPEITDLSTHKGAEMNLCAFFVSESKLAIIFENATKVFVGKSNFKPQNPDEKARF